MKQFTRIEPSTEQTFGLRFKQHAVVKRFRTEDGLEHEFTTIGKEGEHAGAMIALTPDKKVVVSYQFRAGPETWMYELPGGDSHEDEDPQAAARRELEEETGYVPGKVEFLGTSCRGAYINTVWHYYLATNCVQSGSQKLDKTEEDQGMEVRLISIAELIAYAKQNWVSDFHAVLMAYDKLKELEGSDNGTSN